MTRRQSEPSQPLSIWRDVAPLVLGAGGAFVAVAYVVGWAYWRGYLGYFGMEMSNVDVGTANILTDGIRTSLFPLAAGGLLALAAISFGWPWVEPKPRLRPYWSALLAGSLFGVMLSTGAWAYLSDDLRSMLGRLPGLVLFVSVYCVAFMGTYQIWQRRVHFVVVMVAALLVPLIPMGAWLDGRLTAYTRWHTDNYEARGFEIVVLYSARQLSDDWQADGGLFASPPLLLVAKFDDSYVVLEDTSSKDVVLVIPASEIARADYPQRIVICEGCPYN